MPLVPLDTLEQTALAVLRRAGHPEADARTILDVLMYAQLRGNNQGIVKLIGAGLPFNADARPISIVRPSDLSALIDGGGHNAMVVMKVAVDSALEIARARGYAIVGTRGTNTSTGAIGYYAGRIASAGLIGLVFSGSGEYVAMHGAYQPLFGTNPLAFGVPTGGAPLVFDMATSAIARYGLVEAQTAGRSIPPDVAYDAAGQPTDDPTAALAGAIRAFGGYKGAALALIVEILTRALVGATRDADGSKSDWGNLVMAIDPNLLAGREAFMALVDDLLARVKASRRLPGIDEILVPGERGDRLRAAALQAGEIEVEDGLWTALLTAAGTNASGPAS
jgi:LDH2 family malate/lactate/ureidoglycolate dehydrogenase